ncbi:hypothetical protein ACJMK2_015986 [Sinanodonta woodiana]|uniref:Cyclic nucleotide-binding domain-containing protein n=1 Tax=Sinanodonta woodiana TaxID=1069815 RepID=A0ABD3US71_SINWO
MLLAGKFVMRLSSQESDEESPIKNQLRLVHSTSTKGVVQKMQKLMQKKKHVIRLRKLQEDKTKKYLYKKFQVVAKVVLFCIKNFREHCLRLNEEDDELSPFIKQLHFHDYGKQMPDLLFDPTRYKANRQIRMPEDTKRILSKRPSERTPQELYTAEITLRNIKAISEYPARMQRKIAEVGQYETYESKRVIVRQGHPATAFYFMLSGAVVVMVMDTESKYARTVAHLYKGQSFGELAIINGTQRQSTIIAKETCELLSISVRDYQKIFMAGGVKNIDDPDQELFLRSLSCLRDWPIELLRNNPKKCQFHYFRLGEVLVKETHFSDWIIIVKSGSVGVLKKLKRVIQNEKREKGKKLTLTAKQFKEREDTRQKWRKLILPELRIPVLPSIATEIKELPSGRPVPFTHPQSMSSSPREIKVMKIDNKNSSQVSSEKSFSKIEKHVLGLPHLPEISHAYPQTNGSDQILGEEEEDKLTYIPGKNVTFLGSSRKRRRPQSPIKRIFRRASMPRRLRSMSVIEEEEKELMGFRPHIRTITEDINEGLKQKDPADITDADLHPEFVQVQTLTKGMIFGLTDLILGEQPNFCLVSNGADCILVNKHFYMDHASEKLLRDMKQEVWSLKIRFTYTETLSISEEKQLTHIEITEEKS